MSNDVRFIRKGGRIIPIKEKTPSQKVGRALQVASTASLVGAVYGLGKAPGTKMLARKFLGSAVNSLGKMDAAKVGSFARKKAYVIAKTNAGISSLFSKGGKKLSAPGTSGGLFWGGLGLSIAGNSLNPPRKRK